MTSADHIDYKTDFVFPPIISEWNIQFWITVPWLEKTGSGT